MNLYFIRYLLLLLILVSNSWAIDLEQVVIKSYLNEKLEIEILLPPNAFENYKFNVASNQKYQEYGIEKPRFLNNIQFSMNELDASNSIIKVSSITPVSRASFVLLINESAITSEKDKLIVIPINLLLKNVSENYQIDSGDTLWSIAYKNRPGDDLTMNQMMIAVYVMNYEFFMNGIDDIQSGIMDIPTRDFINQFPSNEIFDEKMYARYKLLSQEVKADLEEENNDLNQLFSKEMSTELEVIPDAKDHPIKYLDQDSEPQNESLELATELINTNNIIINKSAKDPSDIAINLTTDKSINQSKKYNVVIKTKESLFKSIINLINEFWALISLLALLIISLALYLLTKYKNEKNQVMDLEKSIAMNEIATKLDLGRAYVDMGDPEGAYEILEEVLHQGTESQRQLAKKLLATLDN